MKELIKEFIESKPKRQEILARGKIIGFKYSSGDTTLTTSKDIHSFVKNKYLWMYSVIHEQKFFVVIEENAYDGDRDLNQEEEDLFKFMQERFKEDNFLELLYEKVTH